MNSLEQYAKANGEGVPVPASIPCPELTYQQRQERRKRVDELKGHILYSLEKGDEPDSVLFLALKALALATGDDEFLDRGRQHIGEGSREEQELFPDLEQMESDRDRKTLSYWQRQERTIKRQMAELARCRESLGKMLEQIPAASLPARAREVYRMRENGMDSMSICRIVGMELGQMHTINEELKRQGLPVGKEGEGEC